MKIKLVFEDCREMNLLSYTIRDKLKQRGESVSTLAKKIGVSKTLLYEYFNDRYAWDYSLLIIILKYLEIPYNETTKEVTFKIVDNLIIEL